MLKYENRRVLSIISIIILVSSVSIGVINLTIGPTSSSNIQIADTANDDWLYVQGNRIVDAQGNVALLSGINWFGFETSTQGFDGLWQVRLDDSLDMMADLGFNLLRLPLCVQLVTEWINGNIPLAGSINTWVNADIVGITSLELLDMAIEYCDSIGMKVMLDMHRVVNSHMTNLWYYDDYTYQDWLNAWDFLTERYAGNDAVVAMDVFNEPHGNPTQYPEDEVAKWDGSSDTNNWKKAVEDVSAIIHARNPNVLIVVEGIECYPKSGYDYSSNDPDAYYYNWWGGNLRAVADYHINIGRQDKLLYSPHDYGASVFAQPWFYPGFNKDTLYNDVWRDNWYYIVENGVTPLLIGEWGGPLSGDTQIWMEAIAEFMDEMNIHQTFWCFNPNSGDTGGIVGNDWATIDQAKYNTIERVLWKDNSGRYVSLDHARGLGSSGTNIVEYYANGNPPPLPGGGDDPIDITPPATPTGLSAATISSSQINLDWNDNTESDLVNYRIYRSTSASGTYTYIDQTTSSSYSSTGLSASTTHYYRVSAVDTSGNESPQTNYASATTQSGGTTGVSTSDKWGTIEIMGGEYIVQNNVWGTDTLQEITVPDTNIASFEVTISEHNQGSVASYPSIFKGAHWGTITNGWTSYRVNELQSASYSWSVSGVGVSGTYNVAAEAWLGPNLNTTDGYNGGAELMIWLDSQGMVPAGSQIGTFGQYQVWYSDMGWNYVCYYQTGQNSASINLMDFINHAISLGYVDPTWYLHDIEAGFELMSSGAGLTLESFSASVEGNSVPNPPILNSPSNINYQVGDTGNSITWTATDDNPSTYTVIRGTAQVASGSWSSGSPITVSVDGLSEGTYTYTCTVNDADGLSDFDSVTVTVSDIGPTEGGDVWFNTVPSQSVGGVFSTEIYVDTGTQNLAAYGFEITWDPSIITVPLGIDGVEAGADGFLAAANVDNNAVL